MKKLLLVIAVIFLCSCDAEMKRCTYEVYQSGKKLPENHTEYIDISKWCRSYSAGNVVYILKEVKKVKIKDIMK